MDNKKRNNWRAKIKRTFTSILPVAENRKGKCAGCGECCKLPNVCPFLMFNDRKAHCIIHPIRLFNCRKYPRTKEEWITSGACRYWFG